MTVGEILAGKTGGPSIVAVGPREKLSRAIALMETHHISQLPVVEGDRLVGSINESTILKVLNDGLDFLNQQVGPVMGKPLPILDAGTDVAEAYRLLLSGAPGIVVTRGREQGAAGVITRSDLIASWVRRGRNPERETSYAI